MALQAVDRGLGGRASLNPMIATAARDRSWYAVFAVPQNEQSIVRRLDLREIESFLPTYEIARRWKNRQRVKIALPLFPRYLFVHIDRRERIKVLQCPGVLQIVGNSRGPIPLPDSEIEFLRSGFCAERIEPYPDLVVGEGVRVKCGVMQGLQGTLVRKSSGIRFVLTLKLINQHAAIQVDAKDLEPIIA